MKTLNILSAGTLVTLLFGFGLACVGPSAFVEGETPDACRKARRAEAPFVGAKLARGAQVFERECSECHGFGKGATAESGPAMAGVVDRPVAHEKAFRYSRAMREHGGRWTLRMLDEYIKAPEWTISGTRMRHDGISSAQERMDLLAYLACDGKG